MFNKLALPLLSITILISGLHLLRELLIPLALATLLVYLTEPLNRMLIRLKIPGVFRVPAILGVTTLGVLGLSRLVMSNLLALGKSLPHYEARLDELLSDLLNGLGLERSELEFLKGDQNWFAYLQPETLTSLLSSGFVQTLDFLGNLALVLLFMIYLLFEREAFSLRIQRLFQGERSRQVLEIMAQINEAVLSYLNIKTMVSAVTGLSTAIILWLFGVEFAVFWGFLTFMLNFIPTVGSLLAIIPPVLLAVIQLDSISLVLLVLTSLGVLQFLVGNVIEPLVLGDRLNLSPLVVLLSLIFWGWLWGVVGMLLSVPIMSAVKITLARTPGGELWAQFMEDPRKTHDRPPTTDH